MAESTTLPIGDAETFKKKALQWAARFRVVCLLDSNDYPLKHKSSGWLLAIDAIEQLTAGEHAFDELKSFSKNATSPIYGYLSYDLKNQIEKLESRHTDRIKFPEMYFFKPRYTLQINGDKVSINRNYPEAFEIVEAINTYVAPIRVDENPDRKLEARTAKQNYLQNVELIKQQIVEGDFYELNYCNEFFLSDASLDPVQIFNRLNEKAKAPFSCFFKLGDKYLLCSSPERFLKKEGSKLISEPIKGTIKKGATKTENEALKHQLKNDAKELAENVMIVDLVRNDLARSSVAGTVVVDELFGVYEFNAVNQMISTISSEISKDVSAVDAIKNAFPMGSMTGAPKVEVMKNIERYEDFKRGLYSGSLGYITPEGDFDFNVVIRSILYNESDKYLSVRVGGAITYDSIAEKEYDEMLLKAQGMMDVLNATL
ncbi:MAG: anthranilate/para-aminobenzoate synthase component [Bacteroidota bacterium]|nr:anthranilate/para-aminobenzoate synthase component [Bacteroidota bacterium]